jgi:hypothetical protein
MIKKNRNSNKFSLILSVVKSYLMSSDKRISINVGGQKFETFVSTICPMKFFDNMFNGPWKESKQEREIFIGKEGFLGPIREFLFPVGGSLTRFNSCPLRGYRSSVSFALLTSIRQRSRQFRKYS